MPKVDFIIVGQGLAGSCLALELMKRNHSFIIIDNANPNAASRIAAGLFNPITGRTNQPTWMAKEIFKTLREFYSDAEKTMNETFLHHIPIYRPFISKQEQEATTHPEGAQWISNRSQKSRCPEMINDPFGGIEIMDSGFLNTSIFLNTVKKILEANGNLWEGTFDYQINVSEYAILYKDFEAGRIIFCNGIENLANPFFNWAPIIKLKGELLKVKASLPSDVIVNRGFFGVPSDEAGTFILGSTYHRNDQDGNTEIGLNELKANAKKFLKRDFEIIGETWGHRPTTIDRRPILGAHPVHKNVIIFNGLGTKGVSLAPFFALHLADWLEGKTDLNKEVNIERFYSLYFQSHKGIEA